MYERIDSFVESTVYDKIDVTLNRLLKEHSNILGHIKKAKMTPEMLKQDK